MVIVVEFQLTIQAYAASYATLAFPRPAACPNCSEAGTLIGHGFYPRHPLETMRRYVIGIKRWYCRACHKTTSLLPSFLVRFRWYVLAVIQSVVVARFEVKRSWAQIVRHETVEGAPSKRTLRRWCQSFAAHAPRWLAVMEATLAEQDPASPELDPLGTPVEPRFLPQVLLQAVLPLLAWAKTRWAQLAEYGLVDRLRFLWHWGYGRGLARLI